MKVFLEVILVSLTFRARTAFKNLLENAGNLAVLVCRVATGLEHLHGKNLASFTQNLMQKLTKIVFFDTILVVQSNANRGRSETKS